MSSEIKPSAEKTPSMDAVKRLMNRLRGKTRRRALTYGFTKLVVELGLWFFATLILDKTFEPSPVIRGIVLAASAIWFIYRFVVYISIRSSILCVSYSPPFIPLTLKDKTRSCGLKP